MKEVGTVISIKNLSIDPFFFKSHEKTGSFQSKSKFNYFNELFSNFQYYITYEKTFEKNYLMFI